MTVWINVHPSFEVLAATTAARLITKLLDTQNERGEATVVLTGGTIGVATLKAVIDSPAKPAVDWSRVNFWWSDERFVPEDDSESNAQQARDALLNLIGADPARVYPMGGSSRYPSPEASAAAYTQQLLDIGAQERLAEEEEEVDTSELSEHEKLRRQLPHFDVLLLGIGPDAHIASLFPDMPGIREKEELVVGVDNSPKPPPQRMSLTLPVINSAQEVWMIVSGTDKAGAVGLALTGANPVQVPAAGAKGQRKTLWLIDQEAAGQIPEDLMRNS